MPSPSTSTFKSPSASRSSLSHSITVRSSMAALPMGTTSTEARASARSRRHAERGGAGSRSAPASARARGRAAGLRIEPRLADIFVRQARIAQAPDGVASAATVSSERPSALPTSRTASAPAIADDGGGEPGAIAAIASHRYTGSPPRAAHARNRRRCRAAPSARRETKRSNSRSISVGSTVVMPRQ